MIKLRLLALVVPGAISLGSLLEARDATASGRGFADCRPAVGAPGSPAWIEKHKGQILDDHKVPPTPGRLVGIVTDHAGRPIRDVGVALAPGRTPPGDPARARPSRTGPDGTFAFDSLQTATAYILTVRAVGFDHQWHVYTPVPGVVDTLCLSMRARAPMKLSPVTTGSDVTRPPFPL